MNADLGFKTALTLMLNLKHLLPLLPSKKSGPKLYCVFHLELIKCKYKNGTLESVYYTVFDPIYPTKTSHSFSSGAVWEHKIAIVPQEHDSSPHNSFFSLFLHCFPK